MKKNTVKGIFLAVLLAGSISAFAQSPLGLKGKNVDGLPYAEKIRIRNEERTQLYEMAEAKGWPITIIGENGSYSRLVRLNDDGNPVYYITSNANSAITSHANTLYPGGSLGLNLTGAGVNAGIWDGGHTMVDHVTFQGRAEVADTGGDTSIGEHPTHVGGTMIGAAPNNLQARGMAYEGHLYVNNWDSDSDEMTEEVPEYGLVVSNHSYGTNAQFVPVNSWGRYDQSAKEFDKIMYNNPTYQIAVAAGNDRNATTQEGGPWNPDKGGRDLLSGTATAKNVLTVAAVAKKTNFSTALQMGTATFSSFGPTDDFRIKPDIADDGVDVFSSIVSAGGNQYDYLSGTSMATPGVSGVIMLLQQHYKNLHGEFMNSATVRGLLINTADRYKTGTGSDLTQDISWGPDFRTGYGIINAEKAATAMTDATAANNVKAIVAQKTLLPGQTYTTTIKSVAGTALKASISWTDKEATLLATGGVDALPAVDLLKNDLDIRLVKNTDNSVVYPWALKKSFTIPDGEPVAERADNNVDTTEMAEVAATDTDGSTYTLTVTHKKTTLTGDKQDYTLVVTGIVDYAAGVAPVVAQGLFNVWPNPANDYLNIHIMSGLSDQASVTVTDMQGRQVAVKQFSGEDSQIAVDYLSAGVYFVKVIQGERQEIKKVIVK